MAAAHPRAELTGVVLAGGQGSRLGGIDKGWAVWHGRPLVEHVLERLAPQVSAIVISANRSLERYRALSVGVIADSPELEPWSGPLAGLGSALTQVATRWALVVPCDAPLLPADLGARLYRAVDAAGAKAASMSIAGRREPLFCLLATDLWVELDRALQGGERSVARWLDSVGALSVPAQDAAPFRNINRLADLDGSKLDAGTGAAT